MAQLAGRASVLVFSLLVAVAMITAIAKYGGRDRQLPITTEAPPTRSDRHLPKVTESPVAPVMTHPSPTITDLLPTGYTVTKPSKATGNVFLDVTKPSKTTEKVFTDVSEPSQATGLESASVTAGETEATDGHRILPAKTEAPPSGILPVLDHWTYMTGGPSADKWTSASPTVLPADEKEKSGSDYMFYCISAMILLAAVLILLVVLRRAYNTLLCSRCFDGGRSRERERIVRSPRRRHYSSVTFQEPPDDSSGQQGQPTGVHGDSNQSEINKPNNGQENGTSPKDEPETYYSRLQVITAEAPPDSNKAPRSSVGARHESQKAPSSSDGARNDSDKNPGNNQVQHSPGNESNYETAREQSSSEVSRYTSCVASKDISPTDTKKEQPGRKAPIRNFKDPELIKRLLSLEPENNKEDSEDGLDSKRDVTQAPVDDNDERNYGSEGNTS